MKEKQAPNGSKPMPDVKNKNSHLKQLEKLLLSDEINIDKKERQKISKKEIYRIILRLFISIMVILTLYFTGLFKNIVGVLIAISFFIFIEFFRYLKLK
jgi:hypothetical protein